MRLSSFMICIGASALTVAAHAQAPELSGPPPGVQVSPAQAQPGTVPGPDGVIHQWGPPAPIVQAAPPAAQDYPPCTRGRTDSCYNPDPRKEADTKAAWKAPG